MTDPVLGVVRARVAIGPVGGDPTGAVWSELGWADGDPLTEVDVPVTDPRTWHALTGGVHHYSLAAEVPAMSEETMALLFGPPAPQRNAMTVRYTDTPLPPLPVKRRGLTGKAYRIARRRHARARRAWIRAGSPHHEVALYLPSVTVTAVL